MYEQDGKLIFSASDLTGFLECRHLTQLDLAVARGELQRPHRKDPLGDIIIKLGMDHETNHLGSLEEAGYSLITFDPPERHPSALLAADMATAEAMRSGVDVIYQATFFDGTWQGHADFLRKVDLPSGLGDFSYEVWDAKLARNAKARAVLQICDYSRHVERLQRWAPRFGHLLLGDASTATFKLDDYQSYYRAVRKDFVTSLASSPLSTYPDPVEHCKICSWLPRCMGQRRDDRHLIFVAGIRNDQIRKLGAAGIATMDDLASSSRDRRVSGISEDNFERLQDQAALQVDREQTGEHRYKLLDPPGESLGLEGLPEPSAGDLFFDIESDRYAKGGEEQPNAAPDGLEYLFGWVDGIDARFHHRWAHHAGAEKAMFERFVDVMIERLDAYPDMHVFHYSPYEPSALRRLMNRYATRENEVDRLLRSQVFVDLYRIVRQSMRISEESYSIKALEVFYGFERTDTITDAGSSMVEYERYLETGDESILDEIRVYNEADCRSLVGLRDWLEQLRVEAEQAWGPISRPRQPEGTLLEDEAMRSRIQAAYDALVEGVAEELQERGPDEQARWLLAQLLEWHRREAKSAWWAFFDRQMKTSEQLLDERECLALLAYQGVDGSVGRSDLHRYSFPDQETKLEVGDSVVDTHTGRGVGRILNIDFDKRTVWLQRGRRRTLDQPSAIGPGGPYDTSNQRAALLRVAEDVVMSGLEGSRYGALVALIRRDLPSIAGQVPGHPLLGDGKVAKEGARRLVANLDESYLPVQGPPGTGKTYTGGRMILELIRSGKRVGVTAGSHKVISNLLAAVCQASEQEDVPFRAIQRGSEGDVYPHASIARAASADDFDAAVLGAGNYDIFAGTAWAFGRPKLDGAIDVLFVDEAGQFSLANAVAVGTSARNIVLLGDPQQLNQPTTGVHPDGADVSALGHVLADADTIAPDRGLFFEKTFRMHPALASYVSDAFYDARLQAEGGRDLQIVEGSFGPGIHLLPVSHAGNRIFSLEEAAAVAKIAASLIGRPWTDAQGNNRELAPDDIIVVAPFNAQVARIRQQVPSGVPVGTVDKFQGQEGVVAIYSMTTSTPEDIPRGFDFLYSRNRLNVAVSRARSFSLVVCSPAMLLPMCRKPEHMRLANALCLLAERAISRKVVD